MFGPLRTCAERRSLQQSHHANTPGCPRQVGSKHSPDDGLIVCSYWNALPRFCWEDQKTACQILAASINWAPLQARLHHTESYLITTKNIKKCGLLPSPDFMVSLAGRKSSPSGIVHPLPGVYLVEFHRQDLESDGGSVRIWVHEDPCEWKGIKAFWDPEFYTGCAALVYMH